MGNYIIGHTSQLPTLFEQKMVSKLHQTSFRFGKLELDTESPYFPARSDLKIMRDDIVATIIAMKTLFSDLNYSTTQIEEMALFVANGAFVDKPEKHLNRIPNIYGTFTPEMTEAQKMEKFYRLSPPLLALETLTNSSMSFIAQYNGMKHQNTTFGNTSIATHHALGQAITQLKLNPNSPVMVCAANCGDTYSYLTNTGVLGESVGWEESAAVANLVLVQSETNPVQALCKITALISSTKVPNLETQDIERDWVSIMPNVKADLLVFSGAFTHAENKIDQTLCNRINEKTLSLFNHYGNLGAANSAIGIIKGISSFSDTIKTVDIIDRDIYGRESLVRIERC